MKTEKIVQGTPEWNEFRATHYSASEAPAMLGESSYMTREQLVKQHALGITEEIDAMTQRRFDEGHRIEALARPLAEDIIGEELYPCVGSDGKYSASFDGLTMLETVCWEHKTMNDVLRRKEIPLPVQYRIQMEQQLMVSGAEKCLFMATRWVGSECVEEMHEWYLPDPALRKRIVAGWEQFEKDVAAYKPEAAEPVVARATESLPAVYAKVEGTLAVQSNLSEFGVLLREFISHIPAQPETDQEFADTEAACKKLKDAEERLESAENQALASLSDVNAMRQVVAELRELARQTRLEKEKLVKARKEQLRAQMLAEVCAVFNKHIGALQKEIKRVKLDVPMPDFATAIRGLKTIASVKDKLSVALTNAKLEADEQAASLREKLAWFEGVFDASMRTSFTDLQSLVGKPIDDFKLVVESRIEKIKAEDAARVVRAKEEAARAQAKANEEAKPDTRLAQIAGEYMEGEQELLAEARVKMSPIKYTDGEFAAIEHKYGGVMCESRFNDVVYCVATYFSVSNSDAIELIKDGARWAHEHEELAA